MKSTTAQQNTPVPATSGYSGSFMARRRRFKSDWAGIGLGDAFKPNLDYFIRLPAQSLFYHRVKMLQRIAASHAGEDIASGYEPKVKPQLSPCYTTYPGGQAAYAALGLTAYLEFESLASEKILLVPLEDYLQDPATEDDVHVDARVYARLARMVTITIQRRLLITDLARNTDLGSIEMYRLFLSSQMRTEFNTIREMLNAVILFGDILPDWVGFDLHPLTRIILGKITEASQPFFSEPPSADAVQMLRLGKAWVRSICKKLVDHLPAPKGSAPADRDPTLLLRPFADRHPGAADLTGTKAGDKVIPPLDSPRHPFFHDPPDAAKALAAMIFQSMNQQDKKFHALMSYLEESTPFSNMMTILSEFSEALTRAARQASEWEDMRSDLLEDALRNSIFEEGPLKGTPTDGHMVRVPFNEQEGYEGEIFDRPMTPDEDQSAYEKLLGASREATEIMRSTLYPNTGTVHISESMKTSGTLDSTRLPLAGISDTIFKRYRFVERADPRGRPTLVIACDGSGSLDHNQMEMLKVLTAAWLNSTAKSDIQVLAGLYHSGEVRPGLSGPLVQWMWHPRKTPSVSRSDAAKCVASLPSSGTGVQSDALSLAYIIEEARKLSAGNMIYLIHITDCSWNRSFQSIRSGEDEVRALYTALLSDFGGRLHTTMVALGVQGQTGFEDLLHRVLAFSEQELTEPHTVAQTIGRYTASIVRERKRLDAK